MAHNSDCLPWDAIAQNLQWVTATVCQFGATDLHISFRPEQAEDFERFAESFAKLLEEKGAEERKKYPDVYDPPEEEDVVLDDRVVQKINPLIQKYDVDQFIRKEMEEEWWRNHRTDPSSEEWATLQQRIHRSRESRRGSPISEESRLMKAFLREEKEFGCYNFYHQNGKLYYTIEIVKALLIAGEMDTLLGIAAHPEIRWDHWWSFQQCDCGADNTDSGWIRLFQTTLHAYICVNVLYHLRETFGRDKDYRDVKCYQEMLRTRAMNLFGEDTTTEVEPHRRFFGMGPDYFTIDGGETLMQGERWKWLAEKERDDMYPYGFMPIKEFLGCETDQEVLLGCYLPTSDDATAVRTLLTDKGLPVEIVLDILELARYEDLGGMRIAHDPFHPGNRDVLLQYLDDCWRILVHCYVLKEHVKEEEELTPWTKDWAYHVRDCLRTIWWPGCKEICKSTIS